MNHPFLYLSLREAFTENARTLLAGRPPHRLRGLRSAERSAGGGQGGSFVARFMGISWWFKGNLHGNWHGNFHAKCWFTRNWMGINGIHMDLAGIYHGIDRWFTVGIIVLKDLVRNIMGFEWDVTMNNGISMGCHDSFRRFTIICQQKTVLSQIRRRLSHQWVDISPNSEAFYWQHDNTFSMRALKTLSCILSNCILFDNGMPGMNRYGRELEENHEWVTLRNWPTLDEIARDCGRT